MGEEKSKELIAFGKALRRIRKDREFTQDQLSLFSRVDRSYISELENGIKVASFLTIIALSRALKISPAAFMREYEWEFNNLD